MPTAATILSNITTALRPLIEAEKGRLDVAVDKEDALGRLADRPAGAWRVILLWDGHGGHPNAAHGMSNARLTTFLHQNMGMPQRIEGKLITGAESFLARTEQLSKWCRALRWPDGHGIACEGLALEDSDWVLDTPATTRAHGLSWTLEYALDYQPAPIVIPAPQT